MRIRIRDASTCTSTSAGCAAPPSAASTPSTGPIAAPASCHVSAQLDPATFCLSSAS